MEKKIGYKSIFIAFLKTGSAFGGGLGVLSSLREQFVKSLKIVDDKEFMAIWGISRVVPGGTINAIAIAIGYKAKKIAGSLIAVIGLTLPGFSVALILSVLYLPIRNSVLFEFMNETVLPAALALIVLAVINLGRDIFTSRLLIVFAIASFIISFFLKVNPSIILIGGGLIAGFILARKEKKNVSS